MVVVLVLDKEVKGSSWQCAKTVLPPEIGGSFVTAAIAPPRRDRKLARRTELMLRKQKATAVLLSRQLEIMLPSVAQAVERTGIPRITARDYAPEILIDMVARAAQLCDVPLGSRRMTIVDEKGECISYELLKCAAKCAGSVTVMTSRGTKTDPLTERLLYETGLAVHTTSVGPVKTDVTVLLDCPPETRVVTRLAVDLTAGGARVVDGRLFNTMTLALPRALPLPKQLSELERCALVSAAAQKPAAEVFKPALLATY
ncbi:MAG TPA: hypothetical protein VN446_05880 [Candidatus Acidoferrum sp.]|nr:hypothetical protein [Candidatus Acidoferrum sp.]